MQLIKRLLSLLVFLHIGVLYGQSNVDSLIATLSNQESEFSNPKNGDTSIYRLAFDKSIRTNENVARKIANIMASHLGGKSGYGAEWLKNEQHLTHWQKEAAKLNFKAGEFALAKSGSFYALMNLSEFSELKDIETLARICIKANTALGGTVNEMQDVYRKMGEAFVYQRDTVKQLAYEKEIAELGNERLLRDWTGIKAYYKSILEGEDDDNLEAKKFAKFTTTASAKLITGEFYYDRFIDDHEGISTDLLNISDSLIRHSLRKRAREYKVYRVYKMDDSMYLIGVLEHYVPSEPIYDTTQHHSEHAAAMGLPPEDNYYGSFLALRYFKNGVHLSEITYDYNHIYNNYFDSSAYRLLSDKARAMSSINKSWNTYYKQKIYDSLKTLPVLPDSLIESMNREFVNGLPGKDSSWLYGNYYFNHNYESYGLETILLQDLLISKSFNPFESSALMFSNGHAISQKSFEEKQSSSGVVGYFFSLIMIIVGFGPQLIFLILIAYAIYFFRYKKKRRGIQVENEASAPGNANLDVSKRDQRIFKNISNIVLVIGFSIICAFIGGWIGVEKAHDTGPGSGGNILVPIFGIAFFVFGGGFGLVVGIVISIVVRSIKKKRH